jgi:poly(3-hydroxybutyrate) depolymerase
MTGCRSFRIPAAAMACLAALAAGQSGYGAGPRGALLDEAAAPGANYEKAEFRAWIPEGAGPLNAVVVLTPGSNGDGRPAAGDSAWQAFASRLRVALLGCRFTDRPHDLDFIEEYAEASAGSGRALVDALSAFAVRSSHPELAGAPLFLWGMSAGGEFNYEFTAWKPERVAAFIVNKGGIYYTALVSRAARAVPGILFTGEKDLTFRNDAIRGLFAVNRRAGALWALAGEPGTDHAVGRSRDMAMIFFEEILRLRILEASPNPFKWSRMTELDGKDGFIGDLERMTFRPAADAGVLNVPTAWLPTLRAARAWRAIVKGEPFEARN